MNPISPLTYDFHPQSELSNQQKEQQNFNSLKFVPYSSSVLTSENSAFTNTTHINSISTIDNSLSNTNIPKKKSYKTKRIFKVFYFFFVFIYLILN